MGTIRVTSSVSGTLDGTAHSVSGSANLNVAGHTMETFDATTTYRNIRWPAANQAYAVLLKNDGSQELKVRIYRLTSPQTWDYYNIPAGGIFTIYSRKDSIYQTDIFEVAVKSLASTCRVIAHVAYI